MALVRAFSRGAPIIVLDGLTTSFDVQAEGTVFEQMNAEETRATKILTSHHFLTVRVAGEILVISEGKLTERSTHSSLVTADGVYAKMYVIQARGYLDGQTSSFDWIVAGFINGGRNLEHGGLPTGGTSASGSLGQGMFYDGCEQTPLGLLRRIDSSRGDRTPKGFRSISFTSTGVREVRRFVSGCLV